MILSVLGLSCTRSYCSHFERALINLIDNAIDASHPGTVVTVTAALDRGSIVLIIKDEGAGMDRETLTNLFMPFFTTKEEGTGLGMPISKKVIEAQAGTLVITSKQGVGTEAKIRLPYKNMRYAEEGVDDQ